MNADVLLKALDPEQREVALALRGPVRVFAGAGTGWQNSHGPEVSRERCELPVVPETRLPVALLGCEADPEGPAAAVDAGDLVGDQGGALVVDAAVRVRHRRAATLELPSEVWVVTGRR